MPVVVVVSVEAELFVVVVSVEAELLGVEDDWSLLSVLLLPVPLAPMLDVPVELLGVELLLVSVEVLLLIELLGAAPVEPVVEFVLGVVL